MRAGEVCRIERMLLVFELSVLGWGGTVVHGQVEAGAVCGEGQDLL